MDLEEIEGRLEDAANTLEKKGHKVKNLRAKYLDPNAMGIDNDIALGYVTSSRGIADAGFELVPRGVENTRCKIKVEYNTAKNAFSIEDGGAEIYFNRKEDTEGIENILIGPSQATDDVISSYEGREGSEAVFEYDTVTATIERELLDAGYKVIIGDSYEKDVKTSKPVKDFP